MTELLAELIHFIVALVECQTAAHPAIRVTSILSDRWLYAEIHFVSGRFLRTITESPGNRCGSQARQITLRIFAFREDGYRDIYKPMLQRFS
ncbi:hypothetical protein BDN71DRAFT_1452636 [Pleurotus eryngii]|uniref:Secreted protein n=1 Tax=Pleurotus eryngii TaxID=5323 RepID=A0A9P5ZNL0_PLEER|nr:hypothetical protein BDN71DRAFT_1452636 [Pleurotus eryngii]